MTNDEVLLVARRLVGQGKGILAIDETAARRGELFKSLNIESTEENRRIYRALLCTTPGLEKYISGVILVDETFRQEVNRGKTFPRYLTDRGILPGIKVDTQAWPLAGCSGEKITEGLDKLRDRLQIYRDLGACFCKWRAVIAIGEGIPSRRCIKANAHALARYAALCQAERLVPIVEPEVLMDGDHDINRCEEVTASVLREVFSELSCFA